MQIAIISDIHANREALEAVMASVAHEGVDRLVCLGDLVGYGADPVACLTYLRDLDMLCVAGNHDRAVTGQITSEGFGPLAKRAVGWTRAQLTEDDLTYLRGLPLKAEVPGEILLVHGALHPDTGCETVRLDTDERRGLSFAALAAHPSGLRLCAFGHTHVLGIYESRAGTMRRMEGDEVDLAEDALYLLNPGAVGQPRTNDHRATYLVLDTTRRRVRARRVPYDYAASLGKIRKEGLAPPLNLPGPFRKLWARVMPGP